MVPVFSAPLQAPSGPATALLPYRAGRETIRFQVGTIGSCLVVISVSFEQRRLGARGVEMVCSR